MSWATATLTAECAQQRVLPVRVLGGGGRGGVRAVAAGGRGVVLAAAARRAAHLRGGALPHRQPRALLPEQLEGMHLPTYRPFYIL